MPTKDEMSVSDRRTYLKQMKKRYGVNIKVIQELLGHSDIAITLRVYGHLLSSMQGQAVEKWEDVFKQGGSGTGKLVQSHER